MITRSIVKKELIKSSNFGHWYGVITVVHRDGPLLQRYLMADGSFGRGFCFQNETQLKFLLSNCSEKKILEEYRRTYGITR